MAKKTFMQGAVILGAAGIAVKLLGAVFRIPLANIIGDTGMGYYQAAYPVYVLLLTLSTAGIPVAISRMVAERISDNNYREAHRVFKISAAMLVCMGLICSSLLFFGADAIIGFLKNPAEARYSMMAIAPALLIVPLQAAFRGYFQGMQDMKPTALSQIFEQIFRVAIGLGLTLILVKTGIEFAAAGASFGAAAGAAGGVLSIAVIYFMRRKPIYERIESTPAAAAHEKTSKILGQILAISIPITIGAAIMPIMNTIDLTIVMRRLIAGGYTQDAANSLYGQLTGMAQPLTNLPQVLTQAVATSLVPTVAAAIHSGDKPFLRKNAELGLRTSLMIALPCCFGYIVLAEPIMRLIYPAQQEAGINAASSLAILAVGMVFLASVQTLTGILQGMGKQMIPVINLIIGALVKIGITYGLTGIPAINVRGAACGTVAAYLTAAVLNLLAVRKYADMKLNFKQTILKPLISSAVMGAIVLGIYKLILLVMGGMSYRANAAATLIAIVFGVASYAVLVFLTRSITEEELSHIRGGAKIQRFLGKFFKKTLDKTPKR